MGGYLAIGTCNCNCNCNAFYKGKLISTLHTSSASSKIHVYTVWDHVDILRRFIEDFGAVFKNEASSPDPFDSTGFQLNRYEHHRLANWHGWALKHHLCRERYAANGALAQHLGMASCRGAMVAKDPSYPSICCFALYWAQTGGTLWLFSMTRMIIYQVKSQTSSSGSIICFCKIQASTFFFLLFRVRDLERQLCPEWHQCGVPKLLPVRPGLSMAWAFESSGPCERCTVSGEPSGNVIAVGDDDGMVNLYSDTWHVTIIAVTCGQWNLWSARVSRTHLSRQRQRAGALREDFCLCLYCM